MVWSYKGKKCVSPSQVRSSLGPRTCRMTQRRAEENPHREEGKHNELAGTVTFCNIHTFCVILLLILCPNILNIKKVFLAKIYQSDL